MKIQELNDYIYNYLKNDKTNTAIMLTGEWGAGKSHYIKRELMTFFKEKGATAIVVSIYGLKDVSEISKSIYMELRLPHFSDDSSEIGVAGKIVAKTIVKKAVSTIGLNMDVSDEDLKRLYKAADLTNKLVILEDVERSGIDISEILGFVNNLVERDKVKVLLVANEDEIKEINKNDSSSNNKYLRIKEKTISDTIVFKNDYEAAIEEIIKKYNNQIINRIIDEKQILEISNIVEVICKNNLRSFIFAMQKTTELFSKIQNDIFMDEFYLCLFLGNIYFSGNINSKQDKFPEWEGTECLSTKLGNIDLPVFRFAYDYIRYQKLDLKIVGKTYKEYKEFRFFNENMRNDIDLNIINTYYVRPETEVYNALSSIEKRLENPEDINAYAYCRIAYCTIVVGGIIGFDSKKSLELMLRNARERDVPKDRCIDFLFGHTFVDFENNQTMKQYEEYIDKLKKTFEYKENKIVTFSPDEISKIDFEIIRNRDRYIIDGKFLSKYNIDNIARMLSVCNAKQLDDFRGLILNVYDDKFINDFVEAEFVALKQLIKKIENIYDNENNWDEIQRLQIRWLKKNLLKVLSNF